MNRHIVKKAVRASRVLNEPTAYAEPVSFSRGIKVRLGGAIFLFISGTASIDNRGRVVCKGDFVGQTNRTFDNLTALLESEGANWHDVVRTTCYIKHMSDYGKFNVARNVFFKKARLDPLPASTCVEATLCRPELLIEIELIAILKDKVESHRSK